MKYITVIIKNWEKYNDRKDVKRSSWFRMEHSFFDSSHFFGWPAMEKLVWIYLLCEASKQHHDTPGTVKINTVHMSSALTASTTECDNVLHRVLKNLKELRIVEVRTSRGRYARVTPMPATYDTNERTNGARTVDVPSPVSFNLELLYQNYPRKQGKQKGLLKAGKVVQTEQDYVELQTAIRNYSDYCKRNVEDPKYIKHFSTFMGEWRDWIIAPQETVTTKRTYAAI